MDFPSPLGPYRVLGVLGVGGQSEVYAAIDERDGTPVALRCSVTDGVERDGEFAHAFHRLRALDHPCVVRLLDHGRTPDGRRYIVMERVWGCTLAERLRAGPLPVEACVEMGVALAGALARMHHADLVHGDVSAANVMLREGDPRRPCLLDLRARHRIVPGALSGTAAYLSPERARGDADLAPSDDVWALNALLFECLAGRAPFDGGSVAATLYRVVNHAPPEISSLRVGVPQALATLLHQGLQKEPSRRCDTAARYESALREVPCGALPAFADEAPSSTGDDEVKLVTALFARGEGSSERAEALLTRAGAQVTRLADGVVVALFGGRMLRGDEVVRAVTAGITVSLEGRGVGIATGRCAPTASGVDASSLLDRAEALATDEGVGLDVASADRLGPEWRVERDRGRAIVLGRAESAPSGREGDGFIGRVALREALRRALRDAPFTPGGASVVVMGARGLGRSRTLAAAAAEARSALGARILSTGSAGDPAPLGALREALRSADPGASELLDPSPSANLAQSYVDEAVAALGDALRGLARSGPTVLVIDDADRLDEASRAVLHKVFHGSDAPRVTLWMSTDVAGAAAVTSLHPASEVHALAPFTREESERYLLGTVGWSDSDVVARASGNPALLAALARLGPAAAVTIPSDLEAAVRASIDTLSPAARELLKRASVFGRTSAREALCALGGKWSSADELVRVGLASVSSGRGGRAETLTLCSELVTEVARALWVDAVLREQHQLAARWLAAQPDAEARAESIAEHFARADRHDEACVWSLRAAERASSLGLLDASHALAAQVLQHAIDPALRWRALVAVDNALQPSGDRALQRVGLVAMDALVPRLGASAACEADWRWCHHARLAGDAALVEQRGARARTRCRCRWSTAACVELALHYADQGRLDEARTAAEEAAGSVLERDDPWLAARALHAEAYVAVESGVEFARGAALYRRAAALYRRSRDHRREAIARVNLGVALMQQCRFAEALDAYDRALTMALRAHNTRASAVALEGAGAVLRCLDEFDDAVRRLRAALAQADGMDHVRLAEACLVELGYIALARGDEALARETHARLRGVAGNGQAPVRCRLGRLLGVPTGDDAAVCESLLTHPQTPPLARVEAAAALLDPGRSSSPLLDAAMHAYVDATDDPLGRDLRRSGLSRRFVFAIDTAQD
jgi:tetratricopeptide (TPR) repeat protein